MLTDEITVLPKPSASPEAMLLVNADQLIDALKTYGPVNITWGAETGMLCGNPLYNLPLLDVSCGNEDQAWAINRAKEAISRGDEARSPRTSSRRR